MSSLYFESKDAKSIRYLGTFGWVSTCILAIAFDRADLLGAAGALGLAALLPYVYIERQKIDASRRSMHEFYGNAYHEISRVTQSEYDGMSDDDKHEFDDDKHEFDETGSDIGSFDLAYDDDFKKIEKREVILAVAMTLQWAFGAAIFDACAWLLKGLEFQNVTT